MLPHPAHPREVVLELRELDLELSLRGDGVLGEDVENQLRPIDDARRQRVLERALLHRMKLVVDQQHLGVVISVGRLQLLELALADIPPRIGVRAPLDDLGDRCDSGRARELTELGELAVDVCALWQHREKQPTLGLRASPELGFACGHRSKYAPGARTRRSTWEIRVQARPSSSLAAVTTLAERLAERTLELVDIPSESHNEAAIRDRLRSLVPPVFAAVFEGDEAFLWARERREDVPLLVLAGHYDTVPAQENVPGRLEDGAVHGCGASDMKGGVAVALEFVRELAERDPGPVDVGLLLFGREELPPQDNPLPALFDACPLVHAAGLAVLLEPTDLTIQAGCVGNLSARVTFHGVSGHSARPWLADNALHRAIDGLSRVAAHERREAVIDGLPFYEVVSVTRLEGGLADNVVPDRAVATLNLRYPPDRSPREAEDYVRTLVPTDATVEIVGNSPPGAVVRDVPLVHALRAAGDFPVEPKQAWTNVADFTSRGIPAVNFGPGATRYAHARDELVEVAALERAYVALRRVALGETDG